MIKLNVNVNNSEYSFDINVQIEMIIRKNIFKFLAQDYEICLELYV